MSRGSAFDPRVLRAAALSVSAGVSALLAWSCSPGPTVDRPHPAVAKNVILLIGDGMGAPQRSFLTYWLGREPSMNSMPVSGLISTHPAPRDSSQIEITDSAAAGTAMACGVKTFNDVIAQDTQGRPVPTILEAAKQAKMATGLVVTCQVTHATPACFAAHDDNRDHYDAIAVDYLSTQPDLILGAGTDYFLPTGAGGGRTDGRDLLTEFRAAGYQVIRENEALAGVVTLPLLGLFAPKYFPPALDATPHETPTLPEMTGKALDLLSRDPDGFFLMVEGSQIDWGAHGNDAPYTIHELVAFDEAVEAAREFAHRDGETLVVVLADHETGALSLGRDYELHLDVLRGMTATCGRIADEIESDTTRTVELLRELAGFEPSAEERGILRTSRKTIDGVNEIVNRRIGLIWGSHDHSGGHIPVTADGPGSAAFAGFFDNTEIATKMAAALGLSLRDVKPLSP